MYITLLKVLSINALNSAEYAIPWQTYMTEASMITGSIAGLSSWHPGAGTANVSYTANGVSANCVTEATSNLSL